MTRYSGRNSQLGRPRPAAYQLVPLTKLVANHQNFVLICDGVGVGKTISAGYILSWAFGTTKQRGWIVCPPNLTNKWALELAYRFGFHCTKVDSVEEFRTMEEEVSRVPRVKYPSCYILPNSLFHTFKLADETRVPVVIFDEIHAYRNPETRWHRTALAFSSRGTYRVGLTATPINNGLDDLISELNVLIPDAKRDALETTVQDMWASEKNRVLNPFVTRFTKEKLGIHFARRMIKSEVVEYPFSYTSQIMNILRSRSKRGRSILDRITHFRMAASSPSAISKALHADQVLIRPDPKLEKLKGVITSDKHPRWIIFCEFLETARLIVRSLQDVETFLVTGDTPSTERQAILEEFRHTEDSVLVMTSVGSEGIDLQFCDALINYDLHWNPMKLEQRIGRIDRVGQEKDVVHIVNLVVSGSIDERVAAVIMRKLKLVKNSPFVVSTLFGDLKELRDVKPLFDLDVLDHELIDSEELLTTIRLSEQILLDDYLALGAYDLSYCDPIRLQNGVEKGTPWVGSKDPAGAWLKQVSDDAMYFKETLEYFS